MFSKCLWSKHQDFAKASACLDSILKREPVVAADKMARAMLDASSSRPGPSSCVGDVEILIASGGLSVTDPVYAGGRCRSVACSRAVVVPECVEVSAGRPGPSLMERMQYGRQDVPGASRGRPGSFRCVGDVEILIPSSSSPAADSVDAWGCCRRCCHVNARASRWRPVACSRAVVVSECVEVSAGWPVSCRWWNGCRTGE